MAVGPQETVLYPVGSRVLAGLIVAICLVVEGSLVAYGHPEVTLRATPAVLLVATGAVVLFWMPYVALSPAEVVVANPLRTHRIAWPAVRDIDTHWSLTLDTVRGRVTAWAAPSPGPFSQVGRLRRDVFQRASLGPRQDARGAELARTLVIRQWEAHREQGVPGAVEGEGVTTRWNLPAALVLVVLIVAAVAGAVWP